MIIYAIKIYDDTGTEVKKVETYHAENKGQAEKIFEEDIAWASDSGYTYTIESV